MCGLDTILRRDGRAGAATQNLSAAMSLVALASESSALLPPPPGREMGAVRWCQGALCALGVLSEKNPTYEELCARILSSRIGTVRGWK